MIASWPCVSATLTRWMRPCVYDRAHGIVPGATHCAPLVQLIVEEHVGARKVIMALSWPHLVERLFYWRCPPILVCSASLHLGGATLSAWPPGLPEALQSVCGSCPLSGRTSATTLLRATPFGSCRGCSGPRQLARAAAATSAPPRGVHSATGASLRVRRARGRTGTSLVTAGACVAPCVCYGAAWRQQASGRCLRREASAAWRSPIVDGESRQGRRQSSPATRSVLDRPQTVAATVTVPGRGKRGV